MMIYFRAWQVKIRWSPPQWNQSHITRAPHIVLRICVNIYSNPMGFSVYIIIIVQKNHKIQLIILCKITNWNLTDYDEKFLFLNSHRDRFPFYKSNDDRWKNSVRHNLSINPHFRKGNKPAQGAGHLWIISTRDSEANLLAWEHVSILSLIQAQMEIISIFPSNVFSISSFFIFLSLQILSLLRFIV